MLCHRNVAVALAALSLVRNASAAVYSYTGSAYAIPDGNAAGAVSSISVSGQLEPLASVTVNLNVSGGYNGDLYAYLSYDGALVPLLNRIGRSSSNPFGSDGSGFNVTLSDSAAINIHGAGNGYLAGSYQADGQNVDPLASPGSFSANGGSITLSGTFGGLDPNGTWTLFFADMSAGGGTSTLNGWSLDITPVPEPVSLSLSVFGATFVLVPLVRFVRRQNFLPPMHKRVS